MISIIESISDSNDEESPEKESEELIGEEEDGELENERNYEEFTKILAKCYKKKKKTKYDISVKPVIVDGLSEIPIVGFTVIRFFDSLVKPMLIDLHFEDGARTKYIYKEGDDLNLDLECQRWARKMNQCWVREGIASRCYSFKIIPFDLKTGLIEFVENSMPLFKFRLLEDGAVGLFQSAFGGGTQIFDYVAKEEQNASLQRYVDYFVGFYLMGLYIRATDRHHGNIMIRESGEIFHIDFGFSLGHSPPLEDLLNVGTVKSKFTRTVSEGLPLVPVDHDMKLVIGAYLKVFEKKKKIKRRVYMKKRITEANEALLKHKKEILEVESIIPTEKIGRLFDKSWKNKSSAVVNAMNCMYYCPRGRLFSDAIKAPFGGMIYHGLNALETYLQKPKIKKEPVPEEEGEEGKEEERERMIQSSSSSSSSSSSDSLEVEEEGEDEDDSSSSSNELS